MYDLLDWLEFAGVTGWNVVGFVVPEKSKRLQSFSETISRQSYFFSPSVIVTVRNLLEDNLDITCFHFLFRQLHSSPQEFAYCQGKAGRNCDRYMRTYIALEETKTDEHCVKAETKATR